MSNNFCNLHKLRNGADMENKNFSYLLGKMLDDGVWNFSDRFFKIISWSGIVGIMEAIPLGNAYIGTVVNISRILLFISIGNGTSKLVNSIFELSLSIFERKNLPTHLKLILYIPIFSVIFYFSVFVFVDGVSGLITEYVNHSKAR
jgi:hypothetical protein